MKDSWKSWSLGVLLVLLTVVAYLPALRGGFVWDDDSYVTDNRTLRSAEGLRQIWLNPDATVQYYPLTFTAFWLEYHLWGLHPFGFHLVNVLLEAINALLFWRLLSRLRVPGAWWAAAVFALHPVHVMSVAWVTELKNVLSGLFYLGALLAYLKFCGLDGDRPAQPGDRKRFYALTVGLFLCALLSKTSTSIFPVAILLILWWKRGRIERTQLLPVLPFFLVGIAFGLFTMWLETQAKGASGQEFTLSFVERLLVAGHSFWFSLGKLAWPMRLTFIYPRWQIDPRSVWPYLYPLGAIALLVTVWYTRKRIGRAPFAALLYFTIAFPALVLVQVLYMMRYSFVADHWQYLGSMSMIPLGVGGATLALRRFPILSDQKLVLGTLVLAMLGLLTWQQGHIYYSLETLWRDTLAKNPNAWMAHNNLGTIFADRGRLAAAISEYREALRINPEHAAAHNNLGSALARLGDAHGAMEHYEEALRLKPNYSEAHNNLGVSLAQAGRMPEAIQHFEQAVHVKPDNADAHNNLGSAFLATGRNQEAIGHFEQALRLMPNYTDAHYGMGRALMRLGKIQEAVDHLERAVQLRPNDPETQYNLGVALEQAGNRPGAIRHFEQALQIRPDYAEARNRLARLRADGAELGIQ